MHLSFALLKAMAGLAAIVVLLGPVNGAPVPMKGIFDAAKKQGHTVNTYKGDHTTHNGETIPNGSVPSGFHGYRDSASGQRAGSESPPPDGRQTRGRPRTQNPPPSSARPPPPVTGSKRQRSSDGSRGPPSKKSSQGDSRSNRPPSPPGSSRRSGPPPRQGSASEYGSGHPNGPFDTVLNGGTYSNVKGRITHTVTNNGVVVDGSSQSGRPAPGRPPTRSSTLESNNGFSQDSKGKGKQSQRSNSGVSDSRSTLSKGIGQPSEQGRRRSTNPRAPPGAIGPDENEYYYFPTGVSVDLGNYAIENGSWTPRGFSFTLAKGGSTPSRPPSPGPHHQPPRRETARQDFDHYQNPARSQTRMHPAAIWAAQHAEEARRSAAQHVKEATRYNSYNHQQQHWGPQRSGTSGGYSDAEYRDGGMHVKNPDGSTVTVGGSGTMNTHTIPFGASVVQQNGQTFTYPPPPRPSANVDPTTVGTEMGRQAFGREAQMGKAAFRKSSSAK